jgi:hypothetical protein
MLTSNIENQTSNILDYYPNELLYKGPALIICNRAHQNYQNSLAYELMRNNCLSTDKDRYPRSIDIESELYRINIYGDKCFYDNYKLDPRVMEQNNDLYKNRNALIHDYSYYNHPNKNSNNNLNLEIKTRQETSWESPLPKSTTPNPNLQSSKKGFNETFEHKIKEEFVSTEEVELNKTNLLSQCGTSVPGIKQHQVMRGVWNKKDTRMKQYPDGVLREQLNLDWKEFNMVEPKHNCLSKMQQFPRTEIPKPDDSLRRGQYYNMPLEETTQIIKQVFPQSVNADYYNFQKDCPQFKPERVFYNISKNRMTPNLLNNVNYNNQWKGQNLLG